MLHTEEILAARGVLWDSCGQGVLIPAAPGIGGEVATLVADTSLSDLEPVTGTIIGLHTASRGLGHVEQRRTCSVVSTHFSSSPKSSSENR